MRTDLVHQIGAMPTHEIADMVGQYLGNKLLALIADAETEKRPVVQCVMEINFIRNSNLVDALPKAKANNIRELCSSAIDLINTPDE